MITDKTIKISETLNEILESIPKESYNPYDLALNKIYNDLTSGLNKENIKNINFDINGFEIQCYDSKYNIDIFNIDDIDNKNAWFMTKFIIRSTLYECDDFKSALIKLLSKFSIKHSKSIYGIFPELCQKNLKYVDDKILKHVFINMCDIVIDMYTQHSDKHAIIIELTDKFISNIVKNNNLQELKNKVIVICYPIIKLCLMMHDTYYYLPNNDTSKESISKTVSENINNIENIENIEDDILNIKVESAEKELKASSVSKIPSNFRSVEYYKTQLQDFEILLKSMLIDIKSGIQESIFMEKYDTIKQTYQALNHYLTHHYTHRNDINVVTNDLIHILKEFLIENKSKEELNNKMLKMFNLYIKINRNNMANDISTLVGVMRKIKDIRVWMSKHYLKHEEIDYNSKLCKHITNLLCTNITSQMIINDRVAEHIYKHMITTNNDINTFIKLIEDPIKRQEILDCILEMVYKFKYSFQEIAYRLIHEYNILYDEDKLYNLVRLGIYQPIRQAYIKCYSYWKEKYGSHDIR